MKKIREIEAAIDFETYLCHSLPRANGEVVLGGTGYHHNSDTRISADDTRHILEVTRELVPSLAVS